MLKEYVRNPCFETVRGIKKVQHDTNNFNHMFKLICGCAFFSLPVDCFLLASESHRSFSWCLFVVVCFAWLCRF